MRWLSNLLFRLRAVLTRRRMQRDLDDEVAFHLEMETRKHIERGMNARDARRLARRAFGNEDVHKERAQDAWGVSLADDLRADLQLTLRQFRKNPSFTAVAVLTLGLGIGAATGVFSIVHSVLLTPLPYPDAEDLVGIWHTAPGVGLDVLTNSPGAYLTYREENRVFEDVGIWAAAQVTVTGAAEPERLDAVVVTDGVLPLLRVQPGLGRRFTASEAVPGSSLTVMLSHGYWLRRYGGDPAVVGREVTVNGIARTIIGILPEDVRLLEADPSLYLPLRLNPATAVTGGGFGYRGVARLRSGVDLATAERDLVRMLPLAVERYGGMTLDQMRAVGLRPTVSPLKHDVVGDVGTVLWVVLGAAGLLLVIACVNVANLLLVRADARRREVAVRAALGASSARIARQLMVESVTLGLTGGLVGTALAYGGIRLVRRLATDDLPRIHEIAVDPTALGVAAAIALATGLAFGLLPLRGDRQSSLVPALRDAERGSSRGRARYGARNGLAALEIALVLVLVIGAGLLIRTFDALRRVDPGFQRPAEVLTFELSIPQAEAGEPAAVVRLWEELTERLSAIPGVASVGAASSMALTGGSTWTTYVEDAGPAEQSAPPSRRYKFVGGDYFAALANRLIAGRTLDWTDIRTRAPVVVVTENFARQYWTQPPDALGRRIRNAPSEPWRRIVGVVGDVHDDGLSLAATPVIYWPLAVGDFDGAELYVPRTLDFAIRVAAGAPGRTGTDPARLLAPVRAAVWSIHPNLPLANVRTLEAILAGSLARTTFTLTLLGLAGVVALVLGAVGVYGVIAYLVTQRRREIGVRMALGATRLDVSGLVLRQGGLVGLAGIALGLGAAVAVTRLMSALLYGVSPVDPLTYGAVAAGLMVVVLLASYLPARRAARVDPMETLRWE